MTFIFNELNTINLMITPENNNYSILFELFKKKIDKNYNSETMRL